MKCWVGTFLPRTGTGTQTISGIVDKTDGQPFTPTLVLFQSAYAALNTLTASPNAYMDSRGADTGTALTGMVNANAPDLGGKVGSWGYSTIYSLLDLKAQVFFGGVLLRLASITDVSLGSFELTYGLNDRTGDAVLCTVFGGDDLTFHTAYPLINDTVTTSEIPQGVLMMPVVNLASSGGTTSVSAGSRAVTWGWDTPDHNRGTAALHIAVGNYRGQLTTQASETINSSGVATNDGLVSAWGPSSYTVTGGAGAAGVTTIAFCGANIVTAAGSFTQTADIGGQIFSTGIHPKWIMLLAYGGEAQTGVDSTYATVSHGWSDGTHQTGFWTGEALASDTNPLLGARYLSDTSVLRFGAPNGAATTFTAVASVVEIAPNGLVTLNWTVNDGVPRQILWFAVGEAAIPDTNPYTTVPLVVRRLRVTPQLWNEGKRIFMNELQVFMQPGVGNADAPDPLVMLRVSWNGGASFGPEIQLSAGAVGEYTKRLIARRLGQGRDLVLEIAATDPALWYLTGASVQVTKGTN